MNDAFISHSEADKVIALGVALALEEAGFSTWYYERDNAPGESYLIQVGRAIENSRALVFIASPDSIDSNQVAAEVVRAYEARVPCLPLLVGITHREIGLRQQTLRQALVTSTSIEIPADGFAPIMPRVIRGLENLDIKKRQVPSKIISETRQFLDAARGEGRPPRRSDVASEPVSKMSMSRVKRVAIPLIILIALVVVWAFLQPGDGGPVRSDAGSSRDSALRSIHGERSESSGAVLEGPTSLPAVDQSANSAQSGSPAPKRIGEELTAKTAKPLHRSGQIAANAEEHRVLLVLIDEDGSVARNRILQVMSSQGISMVDEAQTMEILGTGDARRAMEGSGIACRSLGDRLNAQFVLAGVARTNPVPNDFGMKSVRADLRLTLTESATGKRIGSWTQQKTVAHISEKVAQQTALEQVAEALADSAAQRIPIP